MAPPQQLSKTFAQKRAVLISGGVNNIENHPRFLNDLKFFYDCLVNTYGFRPLDLQVLYANGGLHQMGGHQITAQVASVQNVRQALNTALNGLSSDDLLVLCTTNHGDVNNGLLLWGVGNTLLPSDFGNILSGHTSNNYYFLGVFGHCFGVDMFHQMLTNTPQNRCVVIAASSGASHAIEPDYSYDAFLFHFTTALKGETPYGYNADADTKSDGHIDIQEAFDFSHQRKHPSDYPGIEDNDPLSQSGQWELASKMTLNGIL